MRALGLVSVGLTALVAACLLNAVGERSSSSAPPTPNFAALAQSLGRAEDSVLLDAPIPASVAVASCEYPPGSYVQVFVPRVDAGMRCPDGTCLPPLNGVTVSDPIPVIQRESFMPSIGEITGKYTDATGVAWWVTSDGSCFTTRWVSQRMPSGEMVRMVRLDQSDSLAANYASALQSKH